MISNLTRTPVRSGGKSAHIVPKAAHQSKDMRKPGWNRCSQGLLDWQECCLDCGIGLPDANETKGFWVNFDDMGPKREKYLLGDKPEPVEQVKILRILECETRREGKERERELR